MLCASEAPIDFLGVRQKEQFQQHGEVTKHEADHDLKALRELTDGFRKASEYQSEENQILHASTETTLTRQNE